MYMPLPFQTTIKWVLHVSIIAVFNAGNIKMMRGVPKYKENLLRFFCCDKILIERLYLSNMHLKFSRN